MPDFYAALPDQQSTPDYAGMVYASHPKLYETASGSGFLLEAGLRHDGTSAEPDGYGRFCGAPTHELLVGPPQQPHGLLGQHTPHHPADMPMVAAFSPYAPNL